MLSDDEKVFEARYYLAESKRLKQQSDEMLKASGEYLERSVLAWKEVRAR